MRIRLGKSVQTAALEMPRGAKRLLALCVDASICILTVWFAFYLRFGEWIAIVDTRWIAVVTALIVALPLFWISGLYRAIFRYAGLGALAAVVRACTVYGLIYMSIFTFVSVPGVPRTIGIIQPILLLLAVGCSRTVVRHLLGGVFSVEGVQKALIYGAGVSGRQLAAALDGSREMSVAGFIDDDPALTGSMLNGHRIYARTNLAQLVDKGEVTHVLLAIPSAARKRRNEILETLRPLGVKVRTLPAIMDLAHGRVEMGALRELDIEDLLARDVAAPDPILFSRNILGKTVLVTGAGGSIGSELCRQILAAKPLSLLLVDSSEYALYAIDRELSARASGTPTCIVPLLASVRDEKRLRDIFKTWRPETVYHAAAYKHVPLVEHNPAEGIRNNVFGTMIAAQLAREVGVSDFVLISTDKAVRPTNVMGTSKRLAEMILQAFAAQGSATHFSMVRFGNVLGSSGSVVPLFRSQIKDGGPITLTDSEITRYFMTIPEAAQLVIQAGAMGSGGEVFVLDMGEPVKIIDLARNMVELSGMSVRDDDNPDGDIEIVTVGLRPGEKLYEELLIGGDPQQTAHPLIMKAREGHLAWERLAPLLDRLDAAMLGNDVEAIQALLQEAVPEYARKEEMSDLIAIEQVRNRHAPLTAAS